MTLLVHVLQYQLHLSEINDTDYQSNYMHITTVIQVMYTFAQNTVDPRISAPQLNETSVYLKCMHSAC